MSGVTPAPGGILPVVQVFTASGTYTPTPGAIAAQVIVTGSGGGGGNSANLSYAGSGGGTAIKMIDLVGFTTAAITIGPGGAGNTTTGGNASDCTFVATGNNLTGSGGSNSGTGGGATGGDINIRGGGASKAISGFAAITGGASFWGSGGTIGGIDKGAYGGGGVCAENTGTGGDGGDAVVHITEYF